MNAWTDKSEVERRIELPGGGSVTVKSADEPDSLRGEGLDGAVLDEAAFMVQDVWQEVIRPALSDRQGWAAFKSTPNGFNWFEELFRTAAIEHGYACWQRPTSDNPLVPQAELDAAKRDLGPLAFSQEFEANFVTRQGAEWPADYFGDHIWFDEWPDGVRIKTMALDPSKGKESKKGDYSAFVMACLSNENILYVDADIDRRPAEKIVADGVKIYREFKPNGFAIETNQFQELLADRFDEAFTRLGMQRVVLTHFQNMVKKDVRIRTLGHILQARKIRFRRDSPGAQTLVNQLREFPMGEHDDGPDALEMAVRLLDEIYANPQERVAGRIGN